MEPLNNIDVIILIGVALSMLVAFIRGFVKEVLSILGLALFVVLTVYLSPLLTPWMNQFIASKLMAQLIRLNILRNKASAACSSLMKTSITSFLFLKTKKNTKLPATTLSAKRMNMTTPLKVTLSLPNKTEKASK